MSEKKEKKEIVVAAPTFRREEKLFRDTTGVEAFNVFKLSKRIGKCLSGLMIIVGVSLSLLSVYNILLFIQFSFSNPFFIGALGFLGALNIFCGLVLLAKE
jgi:hypothetical protein